MTKILGGRLGVFPPFLVMSFCILGAKKKKEKRLESNIFSLTSFLKQKQVGEIFTTLQLGFSLGGG
jgi:hypothetical protein